MSSSTSTHRKRKHARRRFLKLSDEWVSACHWCQCPIVWLGRIPTDLILKIHGKNRIRVTVNFHGKPVMFLSGTVDHVIPLGNGGTNHPSNLVGACNRCNSERNRIIKTKTKLCVECGGPKTGIARRRCKKCCEERAFGFLSALPDNHPTRLRLTQNPNFHPKGVISKVLRRLAANHQEQSL